MIALSEAGVSERFDTRPPEHAVERVGRLVPVFVAIAYEDFWWKHYIVPPCS
jgi:hypothetical protein